MTASALPLELEHALGGVLRRSRHQRRLDSLRRGLLVSALALLSIGAARALNLAAFPLPLVFLVVAGAGLLAGILLQTRSLSVLDAARLSDRRAALGGLLTTALTLPDTSESTSSDPPSWEAALRRRVLEQARAVAPSLDPAQIVPAPPPGVWGPPAGLLGLALLAWVVPPLPAPSVVAPVPPAAVVENRAPDTSAAGREAADVSGAPIVNEPEPLAQPPAAPAGDRRVPGTPTAPLSGAASGQGQGRAAGTAGASASGTGQAPRLREARQAVGAGTEGTSTSSASGGGQRTQDTPFGSRESGEFQNQSVTSPDRLAAAPYDPATAPGATPMQQQSDPGSSGLRSASGGRGIESEGADKCVEGCLTNDDMNRGAPADPSRPRAPGGETASGTSDSGSGAAGGSSGVGLGVGTLRSLQSRTQTELGSGAGEGTDRLQVLAAPRLERRPSGSSAAQTQGAAWTASAETPTSSTSIPDSAQATVRAYFERTQP